MCSHFFDMGAPVKTQVENGISKLLNFWVNNIDVSDQSVFSLSDSGLYDEERNKTDVSDLLTAGHRQSGHFLLFMMTVHLYQADTNCK